MELRAKDMMGFGFGEPIEITKICLFELLDCWAQNAVRSMRRQEQREGV